MTTGAPVWPAGDGKVPLQGAASLMTSCLRGCDVWRPAMADSLCQNMLGVITLIIFYTIQEDGNMFLSLGQMCYVYTTMCGK